MAGKRANPSRELRRNHKRHVRCEKFRSPLPVVLIACDDGRTAPEYFKALQKEVQKHASLRIVGGGFQPGPTVDRAINEKRRLSRGPMDSAWALVDCECDEALAMREKARGKKAGLRVALSSPCYEVWTLLHLEATGSTFIDCNAVIDRLKAKWKQEFHEDFPTSHKAQADYSKIMALRGEARRPSGRGGSTKRGRRRGRKSIGLSKRLTLWS